MNSDSLTIFQKLTQGINLKRKEQKTAEEEEGRKVENYTVNKESYDLNDEDKALFTGSLKFIKSHQTLNDPAVLIGKSEPEVKAIHRRREAIGKFLKQNNMKVQGDHTPLPVLDFKDFVR